MLRIHDALPEPGPPCNTTTGFPSGLPAVSQYRRLPSPTSSQPLSISSYPRVFMSCTDCPLEHVLATAPQPQAMSPDGASSSAVRFTSVYRGSADSGESDYVNL